MHHCRIVVHSLLTPHCSLKCTAEYTNSAKDYVQCGNLFQKHAKIANLMLYTIVRHIPFEAASASRALIDKLRILLYILML